MRAKLAMAGVALGLAAWPAFVGASGDTSCDPTWTLSQAGFTCGDRIVIGPGNDTRVNLLLLLRDRAGLDGRDLTYATPEWSPDYGHTFLDWDLLQETLDPSPPPSEEAYTYDDTPDFQGSRCQSVRAGGDQFLAAAARNRRIGAPDRAALEQGREAILGLCQGGYAPDEPGTTLADLDLPHTFASPEGREFGAYMAGAAAFYLGDWRAARERFATLRTAKDDWVRETGLYMAARSELGAAASSADDEWGYFDPNAADKALAERAGRSFEGYLEAYPQGQYAASATGLMRRAHWLAGEVGKQGQLYAQMLASIAPEDPAAVELIDEIDNKFLFADGATAAMQGPTLLAVHDLMRMRGDADEAEYWSFARHELPQLTAAELAAQEAAFASQPELYQFLKANFAYYIDHDYRAVLQLLPDDARQPSYSPLAFSRQALRGMALAALKDRNEAGFWQELLGGAKGIYQRPTAELGLALAWERAGEVGKAFAAGSPIEDARIREILLEHSAGPDILRDVAQGAGRTQRERDLAAYVLLYKELSRGAYAQAGSDLALIRADAPISSYDEDTYEQLVPVGLYLRGTFSDEYPCPELRQTVAQLARNADDFKARLCLGEFYRLNGFDQFYLDLGVEEGALGSFASYPGEPIPRSKIYDAIIAEPGVSRDDRAYALYRAIRCYAPVGYSSCGGEEVPEEQRKAWFQRLKGEFAQTRWAQEAEYYW